MTKKDICVSAILEQKQETKLECSRVERTVTAVQKKLREWLLQGTQQPVLIDSEHLKGLSTED